MHDYDKFLSRIKNLDCQVLKNEPLSKHTTFKIGGDADIFLTVNTETALVQILDFLNENYIPFFLLGNGSNVLASDKGFRGIIIKLGRDFNKINLLNDFEIVCGTGVPLSSFCRYAEKNSLSGAEFLYGIPGTVGGAVFMNAGAYNGEIKDIIVSCTHISRDGKKATLKREDLDLSYRHSLYSVENHIILSATFKLTKADKAKIRENMNNFTEKRKLKQPLEFPNAGSIFKRPVGNFAGVLIEQAGLRGKSIGGAMVSKKHCGFIINKGGATCEDVLNLIDMITAKVFKETGIILENEIKVIGS